MPRAPGGPKTMPWNRCTAKAKSTGLPCMNPAIPGGWTCKYHGGHIPNALAAARERVASVLPLALQRLVMMLESSDDRVALAAARDLLDRAGLAARHGFDLTVDGQVEVGVTVTDLTAKLAEVRAAAGPSPEEQIVTAMAQAMGFEGDYETQRRAVHEAVVPVTGELVESTGSSMYPRARQRGDDGIDDATVVEDDAKPPATVTPLRRRDEDEDVAPACRVGPVSITRQQ